MTGRLRRPEMLALVVVCAALNLGVGFVVATLKLPFYLDSIGTVLATALGGLVAGIVTGLVAVVVGSAYTPTLWAYAGTAVTIALCTAWFRRYGFLERPVRTAIFGVLLGVAAATVSAPVTAIVWKGVSLSGTDALTSFFVATGETLATSVLLGGLATDPVDKLITSFVVLLVLRRVPRRWQWRMQT